jgi:hypothetical protein
LENDGKDESIGRAKKRRRGFLIYLVQKGLAASVFG